MPLEADFKSRMSIGQLAARVGLRTSAIRYYERIGLVPRAERVGGRRVYAVDAVERLERIALAQQAGFSLEEVRLLEQGLGGERAAPTRWRQLAATKLDEVNIQMRRLRAMRQLLHKALRCKCTSMRACPLLTSQRRRAAGPPTPRRT